MTESITKSTHLPRCDQVDHHLFALDHTLVHLSGTEAPAHQAPTATGTEHCCSLREVSQQMFASARALLATADPLNISQNGGEA